MSPALTAKGVRRTRGSASLDADSAAASILAAVQGGVVMLQATGRSSYLQAASDSALVPLGLPG